MSRALRPDLGGRIGRWRLAAGLAGHVRCVAARRGPGGCSWGTRAGVTPRRGPAVCFRIATTTGPIGTRPLACSDGSRRARKIHPCSSYRLAVTSTDAVPGQGTRPAMARDHERLHQLSRRPLLGQRLGRKMATSCRPGRWQSRRWRNWHLRSTPPVCSPQLRLVWGATFAPVACCPASSNNRRREKS